MFMVFLIIGLIFSPIAALMAFLIIYEEYSRHNLDKKQKLKIAIQTGLFTLVAFIILALGIGFFLSHFS